MMTTFKRHDESTAPAGSQKDLAAVKHKLGFVPNLFAYLAESPTALGAYLAVSDLVSTSRLTEAERNILFLTVSQANDCHYCMAAHTGVAKMAHVDEAVITALREGRPLADQKLQALRHFAELLVFKRGWVSASEVDAFQAAGYSREQLLDTLTVVSMKTLSNFANHIMRTPVDEAFERFKWTSPKVVG
jgi:uncharacterized peroxidase-related enzyme